MEEPLFRRTKMKISLAKAKTLENNKMNMISTNILMLINFG